MAVNAAQLITQMVQLGLSREAILAAVEVEIARACDGSIVTENRDTVTKVTRRSRTAKSDAQRQRECRARKKAELQARQMTLDLEPTAVTTNVTETVTIGHDVTENPASPPEKGPPDPLEKLTPSPKPPDPASLAPPPAGESHQPADDQRSDDDVRLEHIERHGQRRPTRAKGQGFLLPDDWKPNANHFKIAANRGFKPDFVAIASRKMRDVAIGSAWRHVDWDYRFSKWLFENMEDPRPEQLNPNRAKAHSRFKTGGARILAEMYLDEQSGGDSEGDDGSSPSDTLPFTIDAEAWDETD